MSILLKGAAAAAAMADESAARAQRLQARGIRPKLAIVRVGERPNNLSYEKNAIKRCEKTGVDYERFILPEEASQQELEAILRRINSDEEIHGCLMFRPLPEQIDEGEVCALLRPDKDVDGITHASISGVYTDSGEGYPPCTAKACMTLLEHYGIPVSGKRVVVLGRSLVIGKPVAMLLLQKDATVTLCHSKSENLRAICQEADIIIAAIGRMELVDSSFIRKDGTQTVIDVGIHVKDDGKLTGDVKFDDVAPYVSAITPVPGGIGAVTTSILIDHVLQAAENRRK
ncbi:MAG: bifunctional 5,10-methylenetetrahydrofolate dehydrogenase/5,10-methenyltetrahydrofolate cyclohydrolase [Negativibacillus sp.]